MRAWLRHKKLDVARFDDGDSRVGPGAVLLHTAANAADGAQTQRWQLREERGQGAWISSLVAHAPARPGAQVRSWFWVEVVYATSPPAGGEPGVRAGVPHLARGLLNRTEAHDSLAPLTDSPVLIGHDRLDELIDILCDPDRRLPAVVASAHPDLSFSEWHTVVDRATWFLPGLASTYLLDPPATDAFMAEFGWSHAVWGGAIRTYLPDVDPAVAEESSRHRVLSGSRILADPGRAAGILSLLPRRLALESPLPDPLSGVNRVLLTQTLDVTGSTDPGALRRQIAGLTDERETALNLAEEQERRANIFFEQRESALAELAERDQRVLELENVVRSLRTRLTEAGRYSDAFLPPEDEDGVPPATFAELLDWADSELSLVQITGDRDPTLALDQSPESSTWARSSWEVLRAMESYATAKRKGMFARDFKLYCEHPPAGAYTVPATKIVRDESESVKSNARWRRERLFPVPARVDPSGRTYMFAHIRVGASASGQLNPRLYYLDATRSAGEIYVGYLGRHLKNTRTS